MKKPTKSKAIEPEDAVLAVEIFQETMRGMEFLAGAGPAVTMFGSARIPARHRFYEMGRAAAAALGRVHFAHTDLSGMALFEEAQHWGIHAAEAILRERHHAFKSWLEG